MSPHIKKSQRVDGVIEELDRGESKRRAQAEGGRNAARGRSLTGASVAINSGRSVVEILQAATDKAREIVGAHQAVTSIVIDGNWARAINAVSLSEKYAEWRTYEEQPDGSGIYRLICQVNRPLRMTQGEMEAHPAWRGFGKAAGKHPPMRGWLAAPLTERQGRNVGLIQLSDKYEGDFTEQDEAILVQLAQMASVAVANVRLESRKARRSAKST